MFVGFNTVYIRCAIDRQRNRVIYLTWSHIAERRLSFVRMCAHHHLASQCFRHLCRFSINFHLNRKWIAIGRRWMPRIAYQNNLPHWRRFKAKNHIDDSKHNGICRNALNETHFISLVNGSKLQKNYKLMWKIGFGGIHLAKLFSPKTNFCSTICPFLHGARTSRTWIILSLPFVLGVPAWTASTIKYDSAESGSGEWGKSILSFVKLN